MATYGNMDSFQLNGNKRVRFLQHIVRIELYFYVNSVENAAQQRLFSYCWPESIECLKTYIFHKNLVRKTIKG